MGLAPRNFLKAMLTVFLSCIFALGLVEVALRSAYPSGVNVEGTVGIWNWLEFDPVLGVEKSGEFRWRWF